MMMNETEYQDELNRAKYFMRYDEERAAFWRGYAYGLHRGHDGVFFDDHLHTARHQDDGQLGAGYRAGILAFETGQKAEG